MTACTCHPSAPRGATINPTRTVTIPAGATVDLDSADHDRRSCLIINRSAGPIAVAFGEATPVDGPGPGLSILAGESLSVSTTAAVHALNPTGNDATVAYLSEKD